jgi:LytS/YehU family sensor histidine kinase
LSHFSQRSNDVSIRLERENGALTLRVSNTREERVETNPGGIGLRNVQRRLELLYPGKHSLIIDKFPERFDIFLKLEI